MSVIRSQQVASEQVPEGEKMKYDKVVFIRISKSLGILCGVVLFCLIFPSFWTMIPRTDSIIYQSYWIEALLPITSIYFLLAGSEILNLATWTEEKSLFSTFMFLREFTMYMITAIVFYLSSYAIWSLYMECNHPLPNLGLTILPIMTICSIGQWFILPSDILAKPEFREKLKIYMIHQLWNQMTNIVLEILTYLFANPPGGLQFLVPFVVVGCRETDRYLRATLITWIMGIQNEPAAILNAINVSTTYTSFITIRIVGTEVSTIFCTVAVDFILHLKTTHEMIKGFTRVGAERIANENTRNNISITLVIGELIEGITPIIYACNMTIAYYGPNAHILSNVRNNYWSEEIEDIGPLFLTMAILFSVDLLNALLNSLWLWKAGETNILQEFCRVLEKYWYFMAIKLAFCMTVYFATNDINMGMDGTQSFQWTSQEGWMSLVNNSNVLTDEEKASLLQKPH